MMLCFTSQNLILVCRSCETQHHFQSRILDLELGNSEEAKDAMKMGCPRLKITSLECYKKDG
jgi:hypothetical protein